MKFRIFRILNSMAGFNNILFLVTVLYLYMAPQVLSANSGSIEQGNNTRIQELEEKAWSNRKINPDSTLYYSDLAIELLRASNDTSAMAKFMNFKGLGYHYKIDPEKSYYYFKKAFDIATELKDSVQLGHAMNNISRYLSNKGEFAKSFDYSTKALEVFERLNDKDGIAFGLKRLSEMYFIQGYFEKARDLALRQLSLRQAESDTSGIISAHLQLASIYLNINEIPNSNNHYSEALQMAQLSKESVSVVEAILGFSKVKAAEKEYSIAVKKARQADSLAILINNKETRIKSLEQLGKSLYFNNNLTEAKFTFEELLSLYSDNENLIYQKEAFYYLSEIYAATGEGLKAYEFLKKHEALTDLFASKKARISVDSLLFLNELELRKKENDLLKANEGRIQANLETQQFRLYATGIALFFLVVLLGLMMFIFRRRRQLEWQMNEANEKYKSILNSGYVSIIATTREGIITSFSKGAEELLGYKAEEVVGKETPAIIHVEEEVIERGNYLSEKYNRPIHGFDVFVEYAKQGSYESKDWTYVRKDGSRFPVQLVVSGLRNSNGDLTGFLGIATDITTQKENERQLLKLLEENTYYRNIIESVEDIIYESDGRGNFVYVNPAMCRITGYSTDELLKMNYAQLIHPDNKAEVLQFYSDQAISLTTVTTHEFSMANKQGAKLWINQTLKMEFDGEKLVRNYAVVQNVTEIYKAKEKAELASQAKTDFLSVMSHEIRTPLNGILGLTNILLQENPRKDQVKNLNLLKFSGDNLLVIINDILDFNKIEAGKITLEETDFNLFGLLESIQQTNLYKTQEKGIELILNYDKKLPRVFIGDSVRLGQVINNLVSNAIKFTSKGRVTMECSLASQQKNNITLLISITDTGKGIDSSKFDMIFERFSQESIALPGNMEAQAWGYP